MQFLPGSWCHSQPVTGPQFSHSHLMCLCVPRPPPPSSRASAPPPLYITRSLAPNLWSSLLSSSRNVIPFTSPSCFLTVFIVTAALPLNPTLFVLVLPASLPNLHLLPAAHLCPHPSTSVPPARLLLRLCCSLQALPPNANCKARDTPWPPQTGTPGTQACSRWFSCISWARRGGKRKILALLGG